MRECTSILWGRVDAARGRLSRDARARRPQGRRGISYPRRPANHRGGRSVSMSHPTREDSAGGRRARPAPGAQLVARGTGTG
jgi:hypothetical protein